MARFIQQKIDGHRNQPYIVTSSAELGFAIGFKPPLLDDALLGFGSRKLPNLFVIEERSYGSHYLGFKRLRPEVAEYISKLKEVAFQETYTDGYYHVYERKSQ